jgi:hypothetical protein
MRVPQRTQSAEWVSVQPLSQLTDIGTMLRGFEHILRARHTAFEATFNRGARKDRRETVFDFNLQLLTQPEALRRVHAYRRRLDRQ